MLKVISVINWLAIVLLAILVCYSLLSPTKGGDAATRGLQPAFNVLGLGLLAVLILLNLLPYNWTKYAAFAIVLLPAGIYALDAVYGKVKSWQAASRPVGFNSDGTPWFQDAQRQNLALAIFDGDLQQVKTILAQGKPDLFQKDARGGFILEFAISEAASATYKPEEKLRCVRAMFDAGAKLAGEKDGDSAIIAPAFSGNAELVKLLLEHGADPNAKNNMGSPALFEAIISYQKPYETVQALLDAGVDPNTLYTDVDSTTTSALLRAAAAGRWKICCLLIERGADAQYTASDGRRLQGFIDESSPYFQGDGYSTVEDLNRLKKLATR